MAGLRDRFERSQQFARSELSQAPEEALDSPSVSIRSAAQRVQHVGFSVHGPDQQSAWKRRLAGRTTAPTETTVRTLLLTRCSLTHGIGGLLLTGITTVGFLESSIKQWLWLIVLSLAIVAYGLAAYWYAAHLERLDAARWLLLGGDLLAFGCLWLLIGPSVVLSLLLPGLILLAALLSDRRDAFLVALMGAAIFALVTVADLIGLPHLQFHLRPALAMLFDLLGALLCLGWLTVALLLLLTRAERFGSGDHWNSAEIARVRIESDLHLRQWQDELALVQSAVARASAGDLRARVPLKEGELASLAAKLNLLLERQEEMFDESQQHRRLERATGELIALLEALHRGERVGWPLPSGTPVDRIIALMRAPARPTTTRKLPQTPQEGPPFAPSAPQFPTTGQRARLDAAAAKPPTFLQGRQ